MSAAHDSSVNIARKAATRGIPAMALTLATSLIPVVLPVAGPPADLQEIFAEAAEEHGVPETVLLGVSYLESRWDAHAGRPSTSAGYGPMHLTDAAALAAGLPGGTPHHHHGEDPRGDDSRPGPRPRHVETPPIRDPALRTIERAARLTGADVATLRTDVAANVHGGAALLADYQRSLGAPPSGDPADWYGAVARYSGASTETAAKAFADEVYSVLRTGAERTTDRGDRVRLAPDATLSPKRVWLARLKLRKPRAGGVECPPTISCEWVPAPYRELDGGGYGNHDKADRPRDQRVEYIVIHDTEAVYDAAVATVKNAANPASWHYSLRSLDGHIAQHIKAADVGWHAGNWGVNAKSIGLEHEGFLATGGSWYTEAMYRTSARLVRYLARRFDIPVDRAHILGHDNVPGPTASLVQGMHEDPGPFWDWAHYFELIGAPLRGSGDESAASVMILPSFEDNRPHYYGCDGTDAACPPQGSASVWLRTEPREDAPLVADVGKHPTGDSLYSVYDHSARAVTGQRYAVAERRGDWTAIWYLGQKAWFHNPASAPTAVPADGPVAVPRPGASAVPVYGRAYPEAEAYPADVPVQAISPLQYTFPAGQAYTVGLETVGEYFYAKHFDHTRNKVVRGGQRYYQIQFGHRVMFVKAEDVELRHG